MGDSISPKTLQPSNNEEVCSMLCIYYNQSVPVLLEFDSLISLDESIVAKLDEQQIF